MYQIISDFFSPELARESGQIYLNYQFQAPLMIVKSGFNAVAQELAFSTGAYTLVNADQLGGDRESFLLYVSILLPAIASVVIASLLILFILDKVTDHRILMFLTTVEGERLSRIEVFSDLAKVPYALKNHVSELVQAAPASAHLQSKFKADLLKVFALFEIKERKPMPDYIRWACKVRSTPFSWKNTITNSLRQLLAVSAPAGFSRLPNDESDPDILANTGVKESFKRYLFKSVETKYSRKVSFTRTALEQSLLPSKDNAADPKKNLENFKAKMFINYSDDVPDNLKKEYSTQPHGSVNAGGLSNLVKVQVTVMELLSQTIENVKRTQNSENSYVLRISENDEISKFLFDYVVVRSRDFPCDPRFGYCIRNVKKIIPTTKAAKGSEDAETVPPPLPLTPPYFTFDLYSLDDFKKLDLSKAAGKQITLRFEDPYVIDDKFIDYAFSSNAFDAESLTASLKRVYDEKWKSDAPAPPLGCIARLLGSFLKQPDAGTALNEVKSSVGRERNEHHTFGSPTFPRNESIEWNPFQDRIILTVAAIFFESVESYRAIVASTGVESFLDMLIVNGSLNLKKWKVLGSIDEIMDEHHKQKDASMGWHQSRIPAFFHPRLEQIDVKRPALKTRKISCLRSDVEKKVKGGVELHGDFSLHGPAYSSKDALRLTGSYDGFSKSINITSDSQYRFTESIEWQPFQPGCSFELKWKHQLEKPTFLVAKKMLRLHEKNPESNEPAETRCIVVDDTIRKDTPEIKLELVSEVESKEFPVPNCHLHVQCFQALQNKVESMTSSDDFEASNTNMDLYAHQLLDAYKPKGRIALVSPFLHALVCGGAACPMLFLFVFWAYNAMSTYLIHPMWTPAAYVIILALFYGGIVVCYFLIVYLDFPCESKCFMLCDLHSFKMCFRRYILRHISCVVQNQPLLLQPAYRSLVRAHLPPFICSTRDSSAHRSPNLRRVFYVVFGFIILADAAVILLFLIWLALVSLFQTLYVLSILCV
jgi:hypothetical protein